MLLRRELDRWPACQPSFHDEGKPPPSSKEEDAQPRLTIDNINELIMVKVRGSQRQPYPPRRDAVIELPRRDVVIPSL